MEWTTPLLPPCSQRSLCPLEPTKSASRISRQGGAGTDSDEGWDQTFEKKNLDEEGYNYRRIVLWSKRKKKSTFIRWTFIFANLCRLSLRIPSFCAIALHFERSTKPTNKWKTQYLKTIKTHCYFHKNKNKTTNDGNSVPHDWWGCA